jgi:DNA helicase HerA-like ATPase
LYLPGGKDRTIVRPDLRHIFTPRPSGAPLGSETDYDDLVVHSAHRVYEQDRPGEVRYFMYEMSQQDPGTTGYDYFWKATRLVKVTRVPRYLRQSSAGPSIVIDQQRDLLAALREQGVLFLNIAAKAPGTAMLFCYGVQATGPDPVTAQIAADEAWSALTVQLNGLYQQLEYRPLDVAEGEALVRYQNEWNQIAVARGRPLPSGGSLSSGSVLDGARTDVENTLNQLEAVLRGLSDKNFIMSLVTYPVSSTEMTLAWKNLTTQLSKIRSEQQGSRSFTAGVAIPLSFGQSLSNTSGNTHGTSASHGLALSDGASQSVTDGVSTSQSVGESTSQSVSATQSVTDSTSYGLSQSTTVSDSVSQGVSQSSSLSDSVSQGISQSSSLSDSVSHGVSVNQGVSESVSQGVSESLSASSTQTESLSQGVSNSTSSSLGQSNTVGQNWSSSLSESLTAGTNQTGSWSQGSSTGQSVGSNWSGTSGNSLSNGTSNTATGGFSGGLPGILDGSQSSANGQNQTTGTNASNTAGVNWTGNAGTNQSVSGSAGSSLAQGVSWGESLGGSASNAVSATNTVGSSQSLTAGQSLANSQGMTVAQSQSATLGTSLSQGESLSQGRTVGIGQGESLSQGRTLGIGQSESLSQGRSVGLSQGESLSQGRSMGVSQGESVSQSQSATTTAGTARSASSGVSQGLSQNQAMSDAYSVAMSRATASSTSMGAVPSFGVALTKATFDESKRLVGDVVEAQVQRYMEGLESGAFFYQLFLQTPDRETLIGAAALMKAAFWGPGKAKERLPQPFHTITDFDPDESDRLLAHARAFTFYRRREPLIELIEPYMYSSFVTAHEAATFCHPPTAESIGLLAVHDSMPVMAMPADRHNRELRLGRVINGERGKESDFGFGLNVDELTHTLIAGTTGSGKTTTLMALLSELTKVSRTVSIRPDPDRPELVVKDVRAGIVGLDWMSNMRELASIVEPERFRFFSIAHPELGEFRWNPLAVPDRRMNPIEWANDVADQMTISFNLGEYGRSLIAEMLAELYTANRLEPYVLMPEKRDENGVLVRDAVVLDPVDRATLPAGAIRLDASGREVANVLTCPELSRLVSMEHLATVTAAKVEEAATVEGARLYGTAMRDRLQSVWRRLQYFAPGSPFAGLLCSDERLDEPTCVSVSDLIDPDKGLVSIIEADGLDLTNRRFILGAVLLAIWRYGQFHGPGVFGHGGQGPGTFVCLEEAHELFGPPGEDEDAFSASTRTQLYEALFRRARALNLYITAVVQNCGSIPEAVTSNVSTVFIHRQYAEADRKRAFSLLNWSNQIGQQPREWRYLGEMARGFCIARMDARESYLESAPVHFKTEPPALSQVTDSQLRHIEQRRLTRQARLS